jgi:polysaccharide export outer membrane protein
MCHRKFLSALLPTLMLFALNACASLPSSGPTADQVERAGKQGRENPSFVILPLDLQALRALSEAPPAFVDQPLKLLPAPFETNRVGVGDILEVRIYEIGVSLFGMGIGSAYDAVGESANTAVFSGLVVDRNGQIHLPYVGSVTALGLTPEQLARVVTERMRYKSQSPQAMVRVVESLTNVAYLSGAVNKAGKYDLSSGGTRLYDVLARAGGVEGAPADLMVAVTRQGQVVEQRLNTVNPGDVDDIYLQPGDRIQINKRPRAMTVFGAAGRASQISFPASEMTLAEAVAQAAGLSDDGADSTAVFLYRNVTDPSNLGAAKRVIYRLNLGEPQGYFVAQEFRVQDKDLIYVANARSNQLSKFVGLVSQLFSPVLMTRAVTR